MLNDPESGEDAQKNPGSASDPGTPQKPHAGADQQPAATRSASTPNREERAVLAEARRAAVAVLADRLLVADLVDADFADLLADAEFSADEVDDNEDPNDDNVGDNETSFRDNDTFPSFGGDREEEEGEEEEDIENSTPRLRIHVLLRHFTPPTREDVRREVAARKRSARRRGRRGVAKSAVGTKKRGRPRKDSKVKGGGKEDAEDSSTKKKRGRPRKDRTSAEVDVGKEGNSDKSLEEEDSEATAMKTTKKRKELSAAAIQNRQRKCDEHFDMMLKELREFHKKHGHSDVPQGPENCRSRLGTWANTIRKNYRWLRDERECRLSLQKEGEEVEEGEEGMTYPKAVAMIGEGGGGNDSDRGGEISKPSRKKSSLTAERIQLLNDLGFKFSLRNDRNYTWEERFEQLRVAKFELHLNESFQIEEVPYDEEALERGSRVRHDLRSWLEKQSELHKRTVNGKPVKSYVPDRLRRLVELGVAFPDESKKDINWEKRFGDLLQYREEHGNCLVPKAFPGGLGEWVQSQRRTFGAAVKAVEQGAGIWGDGEGVESVRGDLLLAATDERVARLREAGFVFSVKSRRWRKKPENFSQG